eukprot:TRINITY_DN1625_c0_g1_i3.p1 TRINITY_DN1625_c0_g1~~TRINITY_DN1625_c0_g1_i3.p1  ORF type:complete len:268 (+),score=55.89 TRINITY_DN1625_c0_g1_i3:54-857(+)
MQYFLTRSKNSNFISLLLKINYKFRKLRSTFRCLVVGRKRIKISYITNEKFRRVTYCKRKRGLLKKAMELSLLCGNDVLLIIRDKATKRAVLYSSVGAKDEALFRETLENKEMTCVCSNEDYFDIFDDTEESVKKPKGLKALKETAAKKNGLKRLESENEVFRDKLKKKGAGLKVAFKEALPTPQTSLPKAALDSNIAEEDKVFPQPECSSSHFLFGVPHSGLRLDAFHSPTLSAFQQPLCSPLGSFNAAAQRNTTEDEARKLIKLI